MKKFLAILLGIALLAASAYAASAWYLGKQVETALANPYKGLDGNPYVKLVKRDYQRGVFTSTESVTIEILGDIMRATGGSPMLLTAKSLVTHGPIGMSQMAAAVVDTDIYLGGGGLPAKGQPVIKAQTMIGYEGAGEVRGTLQPTTLEFPDPVAGNLMKLSWTGGEFGMQFSKDLAEYTTQGTAPKFELGMADGGQVIMSGIRMSETGKLIFPDEPGLHSGTQKFSIDEMHITVPVSGSKTLVMKKIAYDTNAPVSGEFLNVTARMQIADILVGEQNYGPAHFDMSGKNLHARSLAQLQKSFAGMQAMGQPQPGADPMAALKPLVTAMIGVLKHDPEFSIDRLSFNTPDGEVLITAKVQVPGVTAQDAENFMMLMQKISVAADLVVPEALLMMPFGPAAASPEMMSVQLQARQQQIASLIEQGYLIREGALMKSRVQYSAGQVAINGLPFDPMALQQRPMPAGPALVAQPGRPRTPQNAPLSRPLR